MSKQRPYETFEKAFFNYLMMDGTTRKDLNNLLSDLKKFQSICDPSKDINIALPWPYLTKNNNISILWSCLSRLFGEQDPWVSECTIPIQNIPDTIEYIESIIQDINQDEEVSKIMKEIDIHANN